jgi:hypothetical protein
MYVCNMFIICIYYQYAEIVHMSYIGLPEPCVE